VHTDACKGIDGPWGLNSWTHPDGKGTVAAKGRFFRWLADAVTDKTAQFSVEKDDVIYVVLNEKWGKAPVNNGASAITSYSSTATNKLGYEAASARSPAYTCTAANYQWGVGTFTVKGAYSTLVGATALISGVAATLF
jgi:hypothetical protein